MTPRLTHIPADRYAKAVLPYTHSLWGGSLTLEAYVARTLRVAQSPYGRKFFRTLGVLDSHGGVVASFKRYEREARVRRQPLRALGIGAVFTAPEHRRQGHATAMLALALDGAKSDHMDFAYLFSDIHPQFYRQLGFVELPSRTISVRADSLPYERVQIEPIGGRDWTAVRACFTAMESAREAAFVRTPLSWNLVSLRQEGNQNFLIRNSRGVAAYVLGRREPKHDAYVIDEFGYSGDRFSGLTGPLLRSAAGDLQRIAGWLPPLPARKVLPRGSVRRRTQGVLMAAPLTKGGAAFIEVAAQRSSGDPVWIADHV